MNQAKCEFAKATVTTLSGGSRPALSSTSKSSNNFPSSFTEMELMRLLRMVSYYRELYNTFSATVYLHLLLTLSAQRSDLLCTFSGLLFAAALMDKPFK